MIARAGAIDLHFSSGETEPRILDRKIAVLLDFAGPSLIRKLVESHRRELEVYGPVKTVFVEPVREGQSFLLNEPQALLVTLFTGEERAPEARKRILDTFMAHRRPVRPTDKLTRFTPTVAGDATVTVADLLRVLSRTRKRLPGNASAALLETLEFEIQQIGVNDK